MYTPFPPHTSTVAITILIKMLTVHCTTKDIAGDAWSRRCAPASSSREFVRLCDACERSPAAFLCQADSASLCSACDADVHSANPLARRHRRVPIPPISVGSGRVSPNQSGLMIGRPKDAYDDGFVTVDAENINELDEDETASWLLFNSNGDEDDKSVFGAEVDKYFDLEDYTENNPFNYGYAKQEQYSSDSVVPIQFQNGEDCNNQWHQIASIVPESATVETSLISQTRVCKGSIDLLCGPPVQVPAQLSSADREARVLRYREKKKNRKFEKTIRYASRKAYAETRPRIKGRFAKRNEVEMEVDQMFAYGVVPSF